MSEASRLRARPPQTPAQVATGSALRAVWVSAGSVRYILARKVGAASVQPAPPAAARRPSPVGKAGTPAGEAGMGGGGEKRGARLDPRGGGGAESHGRGAGAFLHAQETSVQLTAKAGAGEVAQDCMHREGLSCGSPEMPRVPLV